MARTPVPPWSDRPIRRKALTMLGLRTSLSPGSSSCSRVAKASPGLKNSVWSRKKRMTGTRVVSPKS
ncbi:hypothetical protein PO78_4450 [Thauera sp. SWB20]|nr:hypothetical protein PO78_4450 [Thauera sp. SWB20]